MEEIIRFVRSVAQNEDAATNERLSNLIYEHMGKHVHRDAYAATADDEYVTLDSVLGRGRHEGESGVNLADDKFNLDSLREKGADC